MITAHVETVRDNLESFKVILPRHWEELALNQDKVPLEPDYDAYLDMDARGILLLIVLRDAGRFIGYFVGILKASPHYKSCLACQMDVFYVVPEHRGKRGGLILFKAVESECRRRGVKRLVMSTKLHKDASALFERLSYVATETIYTKWIGD